MERVGSHPCHPLLGDLELGVSVFSTRSDVIHTMNNKFRTPRGGKGRTSVRSRPDSNGTKERTRLGGLFGRKKRVCTYIHPYLPGVRGRGGKRGLWEVFRGGTLAAEKFGLMSMWRAAVRLSWSAMPLAR